MEATTPDVITLDFETYPIAQRPEYPPPAVGLAIGWPGQEPAYLAYGHPEGNNCARQHVEAQLDRVWRSDLPVLFHHSKFDLAVAYERFQMPVLPWDRVHDTMFLAYLCDPHTRSLGLKELATDYLAWPPEERDALKEWVLANQKMLVAQYPERRLLNKKTGLPKDSIAPSEAGAWIFATPAQLCGPYACGDIARTRGLFRHLWPIVHENGMSAAYGRERQLQPILMENEVTGLRVALNDLQTDVWGYSAHLERAETWLRSTLRASGLNFDADQDVANVLLQRGVVPKANWTLTERGDLAMNKEVLRPEHFTGDDGPAVAAVLGYRNRVKTCLKMFMEPWLRQAEARDGYISTNWNQVRNPEGGTRTGRPSTSDPNFLNISKDFSDKKDGYLHPDFLGVAELPLCRKYILPDEGDEFLHRDFDGQELRVFAHFEQGQLYQGYLDDPTLDPHAMVGAQMKAVSGRDMTRTTVKALNFQGLYGGGVPALQRKLRVSHADAKQLKVFHDKALPGRKILNEEITRLVRRGEPIRTWGGRLYFPEAPRVVDGRLRDFVYKLINYEIQGSAADLTKQTIIDWYSAAHPRARFLVTVYDEINISGHYTRDMTVLREVMEARRLTVPMLSSGKRGANWGALAKCD